jgi:hypothetical protein
MHMTTHSVRTRVPASLNTEDVNVLVRDLKPFLETCRLTPESDAFLKFNQRFAQVIEKL